MRFSSVWVPLAVLVLPPVIFFIGLLSDSSAVGGLLGMLVGVTLDPVLFLPATVVGALFAQYGKAAAVLAATGVICHFAIDLLTLDYRRQISAEAPLIIAEAILLSGFAAVWVGTVSFLARRLITAPLATRNPPE